MYAVWKVDTKKYTVTFNPNGGTISENSREVTKGQPIGTLPTGEMENNEEVIACAKVIAVGPKCENVQVGEDVFVVKYICNPVPFRKKGYYMVSESNILRRIVKKD